MAKRTILHLISIRILWVCVLPVALFAGPVGATTSGDKADFSESGLPELLLWNPDRILALSIQADPREEALREALLQSAGEIVEAGTVYSVTFNDRLPPSGNKQDYFSTAPYYWPNPDTPDGLPYVVRDGQFNPERDIVSDRAPLHAMIRDVRLMALAFAVTADERYAAHGARLLRTWFIDDTTGMRPNLNHAQAIPGVTDGRGTGIIDTHPFAELVDAILILQAAPVFPHADSLALKNWFAAYADWLLTHPNALKEQSAKNNHGTAFDMQLCALLWYTGRHEQLGDYIRVNSFARIDSQITPSGDQPEEMHRTRSWSYCTENLEHFFKLGLIANKVCLDLFHYTSESGSGLEQALARLLPFACKPQAWPYEQVTPWQLEYISSVIAIGRGAYESDFFPPALDCLDEAPNRLMAYLLGR